MSRLTLLGRRLYQLQDALGRLLGCEAGERTAVVQAMMRGYARDSVAYWLQLTVALGIATLGLVLSSSAVVIGAMLIAPLMGPIVALAMGLGVGSPFLVLRSTGRIFYSTVVVVGGSAILTRLLPFRELTPEIAARTNPTLLDLLTAAFCAIAGAYAALQPRTTTVAAAGTSIGISLVPPLCTSGFGLGTGNLSIAKGAALLFTANLAAIVVVGTAAFVLTGFSRVPVSALEQEELSVAGSARVSRRLARLLSELFASPGGPIMRLLLPLALLVVVYSPLRRALDEVVWQVRARHEVQIALADLSIPLVQSRVRVERHQVELRLILLGDASQAENVSAKLTNVLRAAIGVEPLLEISAVPDAMTLARVSEAATAPTPEATLVTVQPFSEASQQVSDRAREALATVWPTQTLGVPGIWWMNMDGAGAKLELLVVHTGTAIDETARETIERALGATLGVAVALEDYALEEGPWSLAPDSIDAFARMESAWQRSRWLPGASLCVSLPEPADASVAGSPAGMSALRARLSQLEGRVVIRTGAPARAQIVLGTCPTFDSSPGVRSFPPADAGI